MTEELTAATARLVVLQEEVLALREKEKELSQELEALREAHAQLQSTAAALRAAEEGSVARIEELSRAHKDEVKQTQLLQSQLTAVQEELTELREAQQGFNDKLQASKKKMAAEKARHEEEVEDLRAQSEAALETLKRQVCACTGLLRGKDRGKLGHDRAQYANVFWAGADAVEEDKAGVREQCRKLERTAGSGAERPVAEADDGCGDVRRTALARAQPAAASRGGCQLRSSDHSDAANARAGEHPGAAAGPDCACGSCGSACAGRGVSAWVCGWPKGCSTAASGSADRRAGRSGQQLHPG